MMQVADEGYSILGRKPLNHFLSIGESIISRQRIKIEVYKVNGFSVAVHDAGVWFAACVSSDLDLAYFYDGPFSDLSTIRSALPSVEVCG
nr:hypothetical protein [Ferrovum sp.]